MAVKLPEQSGRVAAALREIVIEHGPEALSQPRRLSHLLADLLPDSPLAGRLLAAAAEERVAEVLRGYAGQGMDAATAASLAAASLAAATMFTPEACAWVVGELAVALGLMADSGVPAQANSATQCPPAAVGGKLAGPAASSASDGAMLGKPATDTKNGELATVIPRPAPTPAAPTGHPPEPVPGGAQDKAQSAPRGQRRRPAYRIAAATVAIGLAVAAAGLAIASGQHSGNTRLGVRAGRHSHRPVWPVSTADEVVSVYFDAINQRNWPLVWHLGAKIPGQTYPQMVLGYATTQHDNATISATDGNTVSVLLVAIQTDGSVKIFHEIYQVSHRQIVHATDVVEPRHLPPGPADFAVLSGRWLAPGRTLRISPTGLGVMQFTISRSCTTSPSTPCDSRSGRTIYRGGVTIFQLASLSGGYARGWVIDSSVPGPTGGTIVITVRPSGGALTIGGQSLTSARRSGRAAYCRLRARLCRLMIRRAVPG